MRILGVSLIVVGFAVRVLGQDSAVTISADGAPALTLTAPQGAKVIPAKDKTVIQTTNMFMHVWLVPEAKTVKEAAARVDEVVKGEMLKFKPSATNALTVAGEPAECLSGPCVEADDGDPATADVVIFTVGAHAFIACVHGEHNVASRERDPMMSVLRTAKRP